MDVLTLCRKKLFLSRREMCERVALYNWINEQFINFIRITANFSMMVMKQLSSEA